MLEHAEDYLEPFKIYTGCGADIKWCNRRSGRKKCCLCGKYVKFSEWATEWIWYYLLEWKDKYSGMGYMYQRTDLEGWSPWYKAINAYIIKHAYNANQPFPKRYSTPGLGEYKFKKLILKGCNDRKPCICVKLAQRGSWYCPHCAVTIKIISKSHGCSIHDVIASDVEEVRKERLLILLAQLK